MRFLLIAILCACCAFARVRVVHVEERSDVLDGASFGNAGPYERITARVHFVVDPKLPANRAVADIDKAPVNAEGMVEFSADLYLLKPRDSAKGNGTVLLEIPNRGGKGMLRTFQWAAGSNDPRTPEHFGDALLMRQGFTLAWLGWQFDVPRQPGILSIDVPRASGLTGPVRAEYVPVTRTQAMPLSDRNHLAYSSAAAGGTLTVRDRRDGPRQTIPGEKWKMDANELRMADGFEPGRIYEFVYTGKDPAIAGLGLAAVRDFIAFLKYDGSPMLLGDQPRFLKRAIGFGTSQSGRVLRMMLYQGFNADEKGRQVFDALWPHVAGAGRGSFNNRFAQPSRDAQPFGNFFYPTDVFPFTDSITKDPATGESGGLLTKAVEQKVVPKIFYTNGSYEYWGRAASLIHTTPDGASDVAPEPSTRIYYNTGAQHGAGTFPPARANTRNLADPYDYRFQMRGLLAALNNWVTNGAEPPPSTHPLIAKGQLAAPSALRLPALEGASIPQRPHVPYRVDYGAQFATHGIAAHEPPRLSQAYAVLVPQTDSSGNELAGIRLPEIEHPLGTYTGWNFRTAAQGAPDEMIAFIGSYFPFARTKAQREIAKDPRLSVEERYAGKSEYLSRVDQTIEQLARSGYILKDDAPRLRERAAMMWDHSASK